MKARAFLSVLTFSITLCVLHSTSYITYALKKRGHPMGTDVNFNLTLAIAIFPSQHSYH